MLLSCNRRRLCKQMTPIAPKVAARSIDSHRNRHASTMQVMLANSQQRKNTASASRRHCCFFCWHNLYNISFTFHFHFHVRRSMCFFRWAAELCSGPSRPRRNETRWWRRLHFVWSSVDIFCLHALVIKGIDDTQWPCGLMDKALVFGTKDCRFESCQGHFLCARICSNKNFI